MSKIVAEIEVLKTSKGKPSVIRVDGEEYVWRPSSMPRVKKTARKKETE